MDIKKLGSTGTENVENAQRAFIMHPIDEVALLGSDGEPLWIDVHGADSKVFRKAVNQYGNRKLKKKKNNTTMEEVESTANGILANAIAGWSGNFLYDGEALECTYENAVRVLEETPWLKEQVDAFAQDRSNFLASA